MHLCWATKPLTFAKWLKNMGFDPKGRPRAEKTDAQVQAEIEAALADWREHPERWRRVEYVS